MRFVSIIPRAFSARALLLGSALLALLFCSASQLLQPLEGLTIDWRYGLRPEPNDDRGPVIIGIGDSAFRAMETADVAPDDPILSRMAQPWPWDRRVFAEVVSKLKAAGARAIVFDLVFSAEAAGDREFATALSEPGPPVMFAAQFQESPVSKGERRGVFVEPRPDILAAPGIGAGFTNFVEDRDRVIRQTMTVASVESAASGWAAPGVRDVSIPSLAASAATACGYRGWPTRGYIDFRLPADRFRRVPIEHLFLPNRWNGPRLKQGRLFTDRIVLIGPWSEARFHDYRQTPVGRIPDVELQAHAIATLTGGELLQAAPQWVTVATVVFMALITTWLITRPNRMLWDVAGLVFTGTLWIAVSCFTFARLATIMPIVAPIGTLVACGALGIALQYAARRQALGHGDAT